MGKNTERDIMVSEETWRRLLILKANLGRGYYFNDVVEILLDYHAENME